MIGASWPVGTDVELAVAVASRATPLVLAGTVRWTSDDGSDAAAAVAAAGEPGVGVQFLELDLDVALELQAHLAGLIDGGDDDDDRDVPATD